MKKYLAQAAILLITILFLGGFIFSSTSHQSLYHKKYDSFKLAGDTVEWHRPRFEERKEERVELVNKLKSIGIENQKVLEAIRHVPRHLFVPPSRRNSAYANNPLPIGHGQTISQPYIVAYMTAMLKLNPGDKVLEIGTGSGYQSAVLSELTPEVYSIEIIRPLGEQAKERYQELGYTTIKTKISDGYYGWKEKAPFDAIIVTASAGHIPAPLLQQLKSGGVMAIPLGGPYETQILMRVNKEKDGDIKTKRLIPVRFVPMTGAVQQN